MYGQAPKLNTLKNGSRAIGTCEPCQAGNRAALNSIVDVPRGSLFRVFSPDSACSFMLEFKVYDLIAYLAVLI